MKQLFLCHFILKVEILFRSFSFKMFPAIIFLSYPEKIVRFEQILNVILLACDVESCQKCIPCYSNFWRFNSNLNKKKRGGTWLLFFGVQSLYWLPFHFKSTIVCLNIFKTWFWETRMFAKRAVCADSLIYKTKCSNKSTLDQSLLILIHGARDF